MGEQRERPIVPTNSIKDRGSYLAEVGFNNHTYDVESFTFLDTPRFSEELYDKVIDLEMFTDTLSRDIINWFGNTSAPLMLSLTIWDGKTGAMLERIVDASPASWGGRYITIIGARDIDFVARATKLAQLKAEEQFLETAKKQVREMKKKDPGLVRFEIELED